MLASHVTQCASRAGTGLAGCVADASDAKLLELYARELRGRPTLGAWLMLYREGYEEVTRVRLESKSTAAAAASTRPAATSCATCADGIHVYGDQTTWKVFPAMQQAVTSHPFIHRELPYLRNYYWFHAALNVWLEAFGGSCYPRLRYLWRMETDVLWTSSIDHLFDLSSSEQADVLLPETLGEGKSRGAREYYHFGYSPFLADVPKEKRVFALVCVGRFSTHFLQDVMAERAWKRGIVGYEEILLPTACLNSSACRLTAFNGWTSVSGNHVKFRVNEPSPSNPNASLPRRSWECSEYLDARTAKNGMLDLWHPVKDRACVFAALNVTLDDGDQPCSCNADQSAALVAADSGADAATNRSLRRRSVAWAERWKEKLERERPFVAQLKANEARAREAAQKHERRSARRSR